MYIIGIHENQYHLPTGVTMYQTPQVNYLAIVLQVHCAVVLIIPFSLTKKLKVI